MREKVSPPFWVSLVKYAITSSQLAGAFWWSSPTAWNASAFWYR